MIYDFLHAFGAGLTFVVGVCVGLAITRFVMNHARSAREAEYMTAQMANMDWLRRYATAAEKIAESVNRIEELYEVDRNDRVNERMK